MRPGGTTPTHDREDGHPTAKRILPSHAVKDTHLQRDSGDGTAFTSSSPRAMEANRFSLVSLRPASTAEKRSVFAVQSTTTLSRSFFSLNSLISLRICRRQSLWHQQQQTHIRSSVHSLRGVHRRRRNSADSVYIQWRQPKMVKIQPAAYRFQIKCTRNFIFVSCFKYCIKCFTYPQPHEGGG